MGNQPAILKISKPNVFKSDSVILITGASSGIGREIAYQYSQRNCRLMLAARNEENLKQIQDLCLQMASQCCYRVCDVQDEEQCKNLVAECIKEYGQLDILVLNAGIQAHIKFDDTKDLKLYRQIMDTNFFGYLYCTKYALPHLKKSLGQIVVISSLSGEVGLPWRSAYCSSKFAVTGFFESLRMEIEEDVAITIICPPTVKTELRKNLIVKHVQNDKQENDVEIDKRMPVEECVKYILESADRRARKIFFPLKLYFGVYFRPFFPDLVDKKLKAASKL